MSGGDRRPLRLGTRGSDLALTQARWVAARLAEHGEASELVVVETSGDRDRTSRFEAIGALGVFARELQRALLEGEIDLAVHSHKDLPTDGPAGLVVAAVPQRVDARDVLFARPTALEPGRGSLPLRAGARVGTASARRAALLRKLRPDLEAVHLRGNVPTRLAKLAAGEADAILLAAAGVARLEAAARVGEVSALPGAGLLRIALDPELHVPAPAQGALALEARADDGRALHAAAALDEPAARRTVEAERALLARLEGGCQLSLGAWCRADAGGELELVAALEQDGVLRRARVRGAHPLELAEAARAILLGVAPPRALEGRRLLLARSVEDNERWGARLEELGAVVTSIECLRAATLPQAAPELRRALVGARALALTSRHAVDALRELVPELPAGLLVAAVGPGTERAAREGLGRCDLVAPQGTGASLGELLARGGVGPVVVAGAVEGRRDVEAALERAGIEARRVEVYGDALPPPRGEPRELRGLDAVLLSSPAALEHLRRRARWTAGVPLVTIGPTTAAAARAAGLAPVHAAPGRDFEALAHTLEALFAAPHPRPPRNAP